MQDDRGFFWAPTNHREGATWSPKAAASREPGLGKWNGRKAAEVVAEPGQHCRAGGGP